MKHNYYLLFILLFISVDCYAQVQTRIFKASSLSSFVSDKEDNDFKFISIPPLDLEETQKEDAHNQQNGSNERFGKSIPVAIGFEAGDWKIDKQRSGHTGDSYLWTIHRLYPTYTTQYFSQQNVLIQNYGQSEYFWYELTVTNACGSKTVTGSGTLNGCSFYINGANKETNALMGKKNYTPTLSINPNPATNELTLNLKEIHPKLMNTLCDVKIVNQIGQTVINQKLILESTIILDISQLANGFYVAQVKGENGLSLSQKLIVNKK